MPPDYTDAAQHHLLKQYSTLNMDQLNVASTADNALPLINVYVNNMKVRTLVDNVATWLFILKCAYHNST